MRYDPRASDTIRTSLMALAATLIGVLAPCAHAFEANQHGLTGAWYNPATAGQGLQVEVYQDLLGAGYGLLQAGWFTFDFAGPGQRWYTLSGPTFNGQSSVPVTIYQNVGGNFNAGPITTGVAVGTGLISFTSCGDAALSYTFNGGVAAGYEPLTRLTKNVSCVATGNAEPVNLDFGLSGNWYQASTSGQGLIVELNDASSVAFLTWYTYATAGASLGASGQRWLTGQGTYVPGARFISLNLYETTGGRFNAGTPAPTSAQVGTATLSFLTCQSALFQYAITSGSLAGQSGTIPETRLAATPRYCF